MCYNYLIMTDKEMAVFLNRTEQSVYSMRRILNLKIPKRITRQRHLTSMKLKNQNGAKNPN